MTRRGSDAPSDGLTSVERQILDLADASYDAGQIARRLNLPTGRVTTIMRTFLETPAERAAADRAKEGCDRLLRAQLAARQHDLPADVANALIIHLQIRPAAAEAVG